MRLAPRAAESDGEDACFLASSYGLTPDDWQEDILDDWLGRRRDGRWAAATCGLAVPRQNGKNGVIEVRELFGTIALGERFLHTAHEVKTARKAFLRIASFFENVRQYPELAALVKEIRKTNGQEAVILTNGGSVEFIARSKGSGRGFTVDVLVCDEAQELTDEELAALLPTISAAPLRNPQVIFTGTPPNPDKVTQGEVFRRVRSDGQSGRDKRLAWTDYGAADGPIPDVDDRGLWMQHNPAVPHRLHVGEIERERALMDPARFAAERFGWWGDPASAVDSHVFGLGNWSECGDRELVPPPPQCIAVAATVDQDACSIGSAGVLIDGRICYGAVDRREGTTWSIAEAVRIQREQDCEIVIDEKGPAGHLIDPIEQAGGRVTRASLAVFLDACAAMDRDVRDHTAAHTHTDELDKAVAGATWRTVGDRRAFARKTSDISMLEAVALAGVVVRNGPSVYEGRELVVM